jgi:hypothetical protein
VTCRCANGLSSLRRARQNPTIRRLVMEIPCGAPVGGDDRGWASGVILASGVAVVAGVAYAVASEAEVVGDGVAVAVAVVVVVVVGAGGVGDGGVGAAVVGGAVIEAVADEVVVAFGDYALIVAAVVVGDVVGESVDCQRDCAAASSCGHREHCALLEAKDPRDAHTCVVVVAAVAVAVAVAAEVGVVGVSCVVAAMSLGPDDP